MNRRRVADDHGSANSNRKSGTSTRDGVDGLLRFDLREEWSIVPAGSHLEIDKRIETSRELATN